ncbi:MAG TPA: glycoside hydrolase family 95 protein [Steroidobacteraceae bacterium]|nr:glycoside hydrolase family 95 protein [Steroidobacteraceae bacterium]
MITRRQTLKGGLALGAVASGAFRGAGAAESQSDASPLTLWYRQPAEVWTEALPIGNGRLGAMIFGGVARERLQLNEDTLYAGGPYDPSNPEALTTLPQVRALIASGKYSEAQNLVDEKMMARPLRMPSYQTVGDLVLSFGASAYTQDYRRDLDLESACARVQFTRDGVTLTRESFASAVDQVIVTRISVDRPGALDFRAGFETPMPGKVAIDDAHLVLNGHNVSQQGIDGRLRFQARVAVIPQGGGVQLRDGEFVVSGADSALVLVAIATNFRRFNDVSGDPEATTRTQIKAAAAKTHETLRAAHVADHRKLFGRVAFELPSTPAAAEPTNLRIRNSQTSDDPQLAALYFQYARYLLIGCSRPSTQPANLQGLWNDKLSAPWGSKYTININTEMNYWPAEPANLAECVQPLVAMVKDLAVTGAVTARVNYGARGWVAHHNTDLWRATGPIDGAKWGMWPTGGAWLCKHLWDRYDYGRDRSYLADVYPLLEGAAQFFLDTLVPDPSGKFLVTSPSISPENLHPHGAAICAGPAMDSQILRDLFANCIRASEILGRNADFRAACAAARARLPEDRIGKAGQLQEWMEDWDMEAPERDHRHVSHLYALFPSEQISLRRTPELAAAARRSLELRGDLSTGWAIAWRINLWARLRDAERTHGVIKLLLDPSRTYPNMFDAHPPFQIDGNFGGANGMMEMLLQCVDGEIELLPALPRAWATGSIRGLRARGGFEVDMAWRDGELVEARLRGKPGGDARVRYREKLVKVRAANGRSAVLKPAQFS